MNETLWLVINTLESVQIIAKEENLSRMLGAISALKQLASENKQSNMNRSADNGNQKEEDVNG